MNEDEYLAPYIKAIKHDMELSPNHKHLLQILVASLPIAPEGLVIKELSDHTKLVLSSLYRVLHYLADKKLVTVTKVKKLSYVVVNLDAIEEMMQKQKSRQNLGSKALKLLMSK